MDYNKKLARRAKKMEASAIREILKVIQIPGMISLAGGLPAPETFPIKQLTKLCKSAVSHYGASILQYGLSEGFVPLRQALIPLLAKKGFTNLTVDDINISTGAQSAIDAAAKILLDRNDIVAVETPTYLGGVKTFKSYEAKFVSIPTDEDGIIPKEYEKILKKNKVKVTYLVPTFQNPTGRTLTLERRKQVAEIIQKHDAVLIEDDPYYELRYKGKQVPPIKTLAPDNVIYIGSMSKIFSPGTRLGYYIAPKPLAELMTSARQGVEMHANSLTQAIATEYLVSGDLEAQLAKSIALYGSKLKVMLKSLQKYFPKDFSYSKPDGGMFVWVEGPKGFDSQKLYAKAIEKKVAFVPGSPFFVDDSQGLNTFRLNFSTVSEENIQLAISQLASLL